MDRDRDNTEEIPYSETWIWSGGFIAMRRLIPIVPILGIRYDTDIVRGIPIQQAHSQTLVWCNRLDLLGPLTTVLCVRGRR